MPSFIFIIYLSLSLVTLFSGTGFADVKDRKRINAGPLNISYTVQGISIHLRNGRHEMAAAPGSATNIKTTVLGNPVFGDLDGNGKTDAAILLTQDPGGSGTFYYLAAALSVNGEYSGTDAVLIGDRIRPEGISIRNGTVVVKYTDRKPNQAMSALPSVPISKHFVLETRELIEITASFKDGFIYLVSPMPGQIITSPLKITGLARGTWFFEGDFPVIVLDGENNTLATGYCTANGDWMTTDYVGFEGLIKFDKADNGEKGALLLRKDNPTGLPQHDNALRIPVYFK